MTQNRSKLIDLFIGNLSSAIVHKMLNQAIVDEILRKYYNKELLNSLNIAKNYREKIHPLHSALPEKDIEYIKNKLINKVNNELKLRISKGYKNINLDLVEGVVNQMLVDMKVKD